MSYFIEDLDINVILDAGDLPPMANQVQIADTGSLYTATTVEGALQEAMTAVNTKANKVQEAWITPTLLNGWTGNIQYRKNQFGRIELKGTCTGGTTGQIVFTFGVGYRPSQLAEFLISRGSVNIASITINTVGSATITSGNTTMTHQLNGVGFYE